MFRRQWAMFKDRIDSGRQLAKKLLQFQDNPNVIVLGLPRGGVVVAAEVARELHCPMDIVVPRKIGCPGNPEFAVGALTEDGEIILNRGDLAYLRLGEDDLQETIQEEMQEAKRRLKVYRGDRPERHWEGKQIIIVDDGIATGSTMMASIGACKKRKASRIIVAVPVMPLDRVRTFQKACDELIYVHADKNFQAVGQFFEEFGQTNDSEVIALMKEDFTAHKPLETEKQQQQKLSRAGGEESGAFVEEML